MKTMEFFIKDSLENSTEDMMQKQEEQRQESILGDFFEELKTYNTTSAEFGFVVGMMEFFAGGMLCIPYQDWGDMAWCAMMFAFWGCSLYIQGFLMFTEKGKPYRIYEKIKYLPVPVSVLRRWCLKKMVRFCRKGTLIFLGLQLFFTLVCYHEVTLGNFLYPILAGFVVPVLVVSISIMSWTKK